MNKYLRVVLCGIPATLAGFVVASYAVEMVITRVAWIFAIWFGVTLCMWCTLDVLARLLEKGVRFLIISGHSGAPTEKEVKNGSYKGSCNKHGTARLVRGLQVLPATPEE